MARLPQLCLDCQLVFIFSTCTTFSTLRSPGGKSLPGQGDWPGLWKQVEDMPVCESPCPWFSCLLEGTPALNIPGCLEYLNSPKLEIWPLNFLHCLSSCVCMPSHFNCDKFCAILWTIASHTPLSMGFSRQEYWSGLPSSAENMSYPKPEGLPKFTTRLRCGHHSREMEAFL